LILPFLPWSVHTLTEFSLLLYGRRAVFLPLPLLRFSLPLLMTKFLSSAWISLLIRSGGLIGGVFPYFLSLANRRHKGPPRNRLACRLDRSFSDRWFFAPSLPTFLSDIVGLSSKRTPRPPRGMFLILLSLSLVASLSERWEAARQYR